MDCQRFIAAGKFVQPLIASRYQFPSRGNILRVEFRERKACGNLRFRIRWLLESVVSDELRQDWIANDVSFRRSMEAFRIHLTDHES